MNKFIKLTGVGGEEVLIRKEDIISVKSDYSLKNNSHTKITTHSTIWSVIDSVDDIFAKLEEE